MQWGLRPRPGPGPREARSLYNCLDNVRPVFCLQINLIKLYNIHYGFK